ncbi:MAG: hypothetical protein P1Q69_05210 [Candidatus Thorarchaeota archaeon]|nr:hypothetical protein [Candidatus Thorarchaeota archaeon]
MNAEQRRLLEILLVIFGVFGIYTYTTLVVPVHHYCDWTGLEIQDRIGHEVTFTFHNGTRIFYCCVNISILAFEELKQSSDLDQLENVDVRCPLCGMLMAWDDPLIVWVYSEDYNNPTTNEPTIVPLCEDIPTEDLCESHFIDLYCGVIIDSPYIWT